MTRTALFIAGALCASGLGLAAAPARAQNATATADAKAFATTIQPMATRAATSADASVVPGGGDSAAMEAYYDNPNGMRSSGQSAALSSDLFSVSGSAASNRGTSSVTNTDTWLQRSFAIANDPNAELGNTSGDEAQTCTPTTSTRTVTTEETYTCERGQAVTETSGACVAQLRVETTSAYDYRCTVNYNQSSRTWQISTACAALDAAAVAAPSTCTKNGESCTQPAPPYFRATQCTKGDQWSATPDACRESLVVDVDTDYLYACGSTYDQATRAWIVSSQCAALGASSPNCALQSETCTGAAAPYFINRFCRGGVQWGIGQQTCDPVRQITVRTQYVYNGARDWNGALWAPDTAETALQGAGSTCQIQATNCTAPSGNPPSYTCQRGYQATVSSGVCSNAFSAAPNDALAAQGYVYQYSGSLRGWIGTTWSVAIQNSVKAEFEAMFAASECVVTGSVSRGSRSVSPYQQYVMWSDSNNLMRCKRPISGNLPPGPYATSTSSWGNISTTNYSSGREWSVNQQLTYGPNPCRFLPTTCPKSPRSVEEQTYTCRSQTNYGGCSAPSGMALQSSSCIANDPATGACSGFSDTYTDPTGGCRTWTDQWLCQAPVAAAGNPVSTPKSVETETWSNACAVVQADPTCSKTAESVSQGPETRTIDGLSLYRDSWALHSTYTCAAGTAIDTCTPTTGGCARSGQTCIGADAAGNCSLWDYTYSCPADDGSGNCSTRSRAYLCSDRVTAAGAPTATPKRIISEVWDNACAAPSGSSNCVAGAITPVGGSQTRNIDGLFVTREPWSRDRAFMCWASTPIDGCTGNVTGCTESSKTCVSTDRNGTCTAWTYNYSCPADDGSGNCSVKQSTYTCTAPVPSAKPATRVTTSVTRMYWSAASGECRPDFDPNCRTSQETCTDPGPTKSINGVQVTAACWMKHIQYYCQAAGPVTTNCAPGAGCVLQSSQCLDEDAAAASCTNHEQVYKCTKSVTQTVVGSTCSASMCLGSSCFTLAPGDDNSADLGNAFAALAVAKVGGQNYASASDLKVMAGHALRCRKSVLGFQNCCKDSGWGVSMGLAQCDETEKTLIQQQTSKACHYVGTFCSNKTFFGTCLTKTMQYCCFEGALGRIVNEAGRPQVSKTWGSAKSPDCSGFTVEQFQQLDLSKVDFTDFYADKMAALNPPSGSTTTNRIGQTLQSLYGSGNPNNIPPEAP